jgi:hypothetical protein
MNDDIQRTEQRSKRKKTDQRSKMAVTNMEILSLLKQVNE